MTRARVLVVAASGHGSTTEVARRIGSTIAAAGHAVDVRPIDDAVDVAGYDLVVVGGAIRYDRWLRGATAFVRDHRSELASTSVGFFFTCLALSKPGAQSTRSADQYESRIRSIAPELEPLMVGRFAGAVDPSRMNPLLRIAARAFLAVRGVGASDHRDWDAIDAWTDHLLMSYAERTGPHRAETM